MVQACLVCDRSLGLEQRIAVWTDRSINRHVQPSVEPRQRRHLHDVAVVDVQHTTFGNPQSYSSAGREIDLCTIPKARTLRFLQVGRVKGIRDSRSALPWVEEIRTQSESHNSRSNGNSVLEVTRPSPGIHMVL